MKTLFSKALWSYATLVVCILFTTAALQAQDASYVEVKGEVTNDMTNDDIAAATIQLVGTNISTVTNTEGAFLLKVPVDFTDRQILIKALGFKQRLFDIPEDGKDLNIALTPTSIDLAEIELVSFKSPEDLVRKVFDGRKANYLSDPTVMTAFYRETIKKRNRNASLAEAVVNIYKQPYTSGGKDHVSLVKARKSTDYTRLDTVALKLQGGPFSTLYVDIMKYPEYIFTQETMEAYDFEFGGTTEINGRNVYAVHFEQRPEIMTPLYEGTLYIDPSAPALVKATYNLNITDNYEVMKMFVKRKPTDVRIRPRNISYEVNYREDGNRWYYGYSNAELSFEVKKRRRLFKSIFTLSCEMAVTDWKVAASEGLNRKGNITEYVIMADQSSGFGDPEFWGEYNVIEPEKSIESAIRKIQRRLEKEPSSGAGLGGK